MDILKDCADALHANDSLDLATQSALWDRAENELALRRAVGALKDLEILLDSCPWVGTINAKWDWLEVSAGSCPLAIQLCQFNPPMPDQKQDRGWRQIKCSTVVESAAVAARLAAGVLRESDRSSEAFNGEAMKAAIEISLGGSGFSGQAAWKFLAQARSISFQLGKALTWASLNGPDWTQGGSLMHGRWSAQLESGLDARGLASGLGLAGLAAVIEARELDKAAGQATAPARSASL
jgi:hypothetical protein